MANRRIKKLIATKQMTKREKFEQYRDAPLSRSITEMHQRMRMVARYGTYQKIIDNDTIEVYIKKKNTLYVTIRKIARI